MARLLLLGMLLVCFAGCQEEPAIVRQKVPHIEQRPDHREKDRLVAALVAKNDSLWSFKMAGPESSVNPHKEAFLAVLKSVEFVDGPKKLRWKLPEGWKEEPADANRFATLRTAPPEVDVTILELPRAPGHLLPNVNRWLGQLGQDPLDEKELAKDERVTAMQIGGEPGHVVDIVGRMNKKAKMPMAVRPKAPPAKAPQEASDIEFAVPNGWAKVQPGNAMIREQYDIVEGNGKAEFTINVLGGEGGGKVANLQRWRGIIKLPPATDNELATAFTKIEANGGPAEMVDIENPAAPKDKNRMLAAIVPAGDRTYFLKLMGPSDIVGRNKDRFLEVAKSVRIK